LKTIPESIGDLKQIDLICLLNTCKGSLENLPNCLGNLSWLKKLDLSNFEKLKDLPFSVMSMVDLEEINLSWYTISCFLFALPYVENELHVFNL
jgi:hypothetical protein